jgi:hypothetical protein
VDLSSSAVTRFNLFLKERPPLIAAAKSGRKQVTDLPADSRPGDGRLNRPAGSSGIGLDLSFFGPDGLATHQAPVRIPAVSRPFVRQFRTSKLDHLSEVLVENSRPTRGMASRALAGPRSVEDVSVSHIPSPASCYRLPAE